MQGEARKIVANQLDHPEILDNQGIRSQFFQDGQGLNDLGQILFPRQAVGGKIELQPVFPAVVNHGGNLLQSKIAGQIPGVQTGSADVNGIGAGLNTGPKGFHIAGRGE